MEHFIFLKHGIEDIYAANGRVEGVVKYHITYRKVRGFLLMLLTISVLTKINIGKKKMVFFFNMYTM